MVGTLLMVMLYFLMKREAAIDAMLRARPGPPASGRPSTNHNRQSHRPVSQPMREELAG